MSGRRGCKLTLEAKPEEIFATTWLTSHGKKMIHRRVDI